MQEPDWAALRCIADAPTIDRFMLKAGAQKIENLIAAPGVKIADYLFQKENVVIELKILETEFGRTHEFRQKTHRLIQKHAALGMRGPLLGGKFSRDFLVEYFDLFRGPLSRIVKRANNQIKSTKSHLGLSTASGLVWCVNDSFRELNPGMVVQFLERIMKGSCSSVDGLAYLTNHAVEVPGSDFANFLWAPVYSVRASDDLVKFVDHLGRAWFDFVEDEQGKYDNREEQADAALVLLSKTIRPRVGE